MACRNNELGMSIVDCRFKASVEGRQAGRRTIIIQESDKNPTSSPTQAHLTYVAVAVGTPLVVGVGIGVNPFHTTPPGGTGRNATRLKSAATSVEKNNNQYTTQHKKK